MTTIDDEMPMVTSSKALCLTKQESYDNIKVLVQNMVEFKTKLPKDITAEKIQIHFVPNNWEDPDLDTEQNKLPSN